MQLPTFARLLAALSLALVASAAISPRVVHESRSRIPAGWAPARRAAADLTLPLRVGLAQSNMDRLEEYLMEVSHPESPSYGQHWSPKQVKDAFRPSKESADTVRSWLVEAGVDPATVRLSKSGGWVEANVSVAQAEQLLGTEYYVYSHAESGREHVGCDSKYHLPEHVSRHVELVTPTLHFDYKHKREIHHVGRDYVPGGSPGSGVVSPKTTGTIGTILNELDECDEQITPICLRALYDYVYTPLAASKNTYAIVEYTPEAYVASDLDMFFSNFSPSQVGQRPTLFSIDGGYEQTDYGGFDYNGEANLDLEYAMALVGEHQPIQLLQAGDLYEGASFGNLLDAIDGSYCTFEGGDDPTEDAPYPDPYGYDEPENCGTVAPAYIMSTSYGYDEAELTPAYAERQCAEYAKLGLMGMTVLYSSGDYGVAGNGGECLDAQGQDYGGSVFNPSFPGTCPYVTSVGATQVNPNATVWEPESACMQVIYSGGGFSNVFAMPSYQKDAVEHYLSAYPPPYASNLYNSSGTSRAFPDISANGANYVVSVQGEFYLVYGTSCSSPVSGAILSSVNDARLAIGKGPIGFINPVIYTPLGQLAFNDITTGSNPGCGTEGFYAQPGWDPVTGVGTPNFPKLLALFLALP